MLKNREIPEDPILQELLHVTVVVSLAICSVIAGQVEGETRTVTEVITEEAQDVITVMESVTLPEIVPKAAEIEDEATAGAVVDLEMTKDVMIDLDREVLDIEFLNCVF